MLGRLQLNKWFNDIKDDASRLRERQIVSRAAWGFFVFESLAAYAYLQLSAFPPPTIPRCFEPAPGPTLPCLPNLDLHGNEHTAESRCPPLVRGVLDATCDMCVMLYESLSLSPAGANAAGTNGDVSALRSLLHAVNRWHARLTRSLREDINFTHQTCYLRYYL
jgi:hypothetical protein